MNLAAAISADQCPGCGQVHGRITGYPTCPAHGHALYQRDVTEDGFTYACPAWKCRHTHTQPERATMTQTIEAAHAALAIRDGQDMWDPRQLAALAQLGVENAPKGDLAVFLHRCQVTGLDPFAGQICMVKRGGRWVIQTEIDGYRVIAQRAARRDGVVLSYGPTKWYDRAGGAHDIWLGDEPPAGASVTVYKDGKPFPGVARFKSFAAVTKDGQLMANWATMPDHMIAKCAEAQALRKAFPHDLEGTTTSDEAAHAARAPQVTVTQVTPTWKPGPQRAPDPVLAKSLMTAIGKQFDRLGLDDETERETYVRKLSQDAQGELTEHQLRFALGALGECEDIAALQELITPEGAGE
jgi:phage recombination protein Bet